MPDRAANPARRLPWTRNLLPLPGALLSLLPSATCPVCAAAYAGVFSAIGLGFLLDEQLLAPLIAVFLAAGVASVAWSTRRHRRPGPLLGTLAGSMAVAVGRLVWNLPVLVYVGVTLLLVASLWNLLAKRLRLEPRALFKKGNSS